MPLAAAPNPATRMRWALLAVLLLALALGYPAALLLPVNAGWENGLLENLQVALLVLGGVLAWRFARAGQGQGGALARAMVPVWLALAGRELSWGAVFGEPLRVAAWGPVYSSSTLWWRPAVFPVLAALLAFSLFVMLRQRVFGLLWALARSTPFVWRELALVLLAGLLGTYAEGHLPGLPAPAGLGDQALVMEEWMETVVYAGLLAAQWQLFRLLRAGAPLHR